MNKIVIHLPYPPSMNHYWRSVQGRMLISKKGRSFRVNVVAAVIEQHGFQALSIPGRLLVSITVSCPDRRRRDLDNLLKPTLDALQHAGVYEDDSQIDYLSISRCVPQPRGAAIVTIQQVKE